MTTLSSYSPVQQHALTRYGRLKMLQRDVLPQLDSSDFRVKLTLKALYSTYQELHELGLEKEARLLTDPGAPAPPSDDTQRGCSTVRRMNIVIPDDYPPTYGSLEQVDLLRLGPYGVVKLFSTRAADRAELFDRIAPAEVIINVRAYTALDDEAFGQAPRLKLVSILGTGTDNVDLAAATRRGITVTNTPGVGAPSVAELTLGLMLSVVRAIPPSDSRLRQGTWQHVEGPELAGKTLGLLGLGAIGQYVARLGSGLGMRVIAWTYSHDLARAQRLGVELVERDDVFRRADVVSVHLRNTPEMRGIVGARELALMKPTAYLINTARGALVDESALAETLRAERIAGAALDVYTEEPLPPERNPFLELSNVVLTPHIGAVTREANVRSRAMPIDNIIAYVEGRARNVVA